MPHPSHSVGYKTLDQVSKNKLLKKFRPITDKKLYKWTYKKDAKLHKKYYKGSAWVLLAFIGFIGIIAAIKFIFV